MEIVRCEGGWYQKWHLKHVIEVTARDISVALNRSSNSNKEYVVSLKYARGITHIITKRTYTVWCRHLNFKPSYSKQKIWIYINALNNIFCTDDTATVYTNKNYDNLKNRAEKVKLDKKLTGYKLSNFEQS